MHLWRGHSWQLLASYGVQMLAVALLGRHAMAGREHAGCNVFFVDPLVGECGGV